MKKIAVFVCVIAFIFVSCPGVEEDWPEGMPKYEGITMTVNGNNLDLYSVRANNRYAFSNSAENNCDQIPVAIFDMGGVVNVEVTLSVNPVDVFIRPLRSNITHAVNGKKITFTITEPGQYSVEWNNNANNPKNALLIFANKAEDFRAIENSSKTITYEIGVYELDAPIRVGAGETLYLKQGAVIRGAVVMDGNNSKIVGRGIIDGSHLKNWVNINYKATLPIEAYGKNNIEISGITIFDPNAWTVQLNNSSNVTIDNLKIISSRCNSDGISIQSSDNITITNSFFRTWDDGIVIKNYGNRDSHTITAKNNILWTDLAQSMEIGVETNKGKKANPKIYNIKFEDNVVLHALHKAPISIHNGDNAEISNVTFKNITIENYQSGNGDGWNYLIDITNLTGSSMGGAGSWTTVNDRGSIHDVIIENVKILSGKNPGARFSSHQGGSIYDVTVKDVYYDTDKLDFSGEVKDGNTTITFE